MNDKHDLSLKIDPEADTSVLTTTDLEKFPFPIEIKPCQDILTGCGGSRIQNIGYCILNIKFKDKTKNAKFNIVDLNSAGPSLLGCRQSQELGIITVHLDNVSETPKISPPSTESKIDTPIETLSKSQVLKDYSDCFDKIGRFPREKYHITLKDNPSPVVHAPRTVPLHILPLYKAELQQMLENNVIVEVNDPTEWVNSIVCNIKEDPNGQKKIRLCLNPKYLNKSIQREHYYNRTIYEILPALYGKKYFSVVDTKKGYWHIELDYESSLLCTFNTPFGRFRFKRLPCGVALSQDIFQRKLDEIYKDIPNVTGIADDIVVSGETPEEHDKAFLKMLEATRKNNVSLNSVKLQFREQKVDFFGHCLSEKGMQPSADKLEALKSIKVPSNAKELQTLLGMVTYLNRFSVKLAQMTVPLRELTRKHAVFKWEPTHQTAFNNIKKELCSAQIISYYDPNPETKTILQVDASQGGLGAWIRQVDGNGHEHIVAMASRSLTGTETRYSNIERECLAVTFGLDKFEYYLQGRHTLTDHAPLEQIFKKNIAESPLRLQKMLVKCLRFDKEVQYKKGQLIPLADGLS